MLTHRNMLTAATSITTYLENVEDDVILGVLPLAFDYGLYQMIMAFRVGARLVLERSFAFPAAGARASMAEERVTGLPRRADDLRHPRRDEDARSSTTSPAIRYVTNTAAALPVKHIAVLQRALPDSARIYSMYGLTECKRCTYLPPEDLERKPTSVGIAIPNTELWIVDEDGQRLGPDEVGQLVIRGATVMKGYWEKPEATAKKLQPGPLPGEQVLYTGDFCRLDDEGYLYFVGRMDDIIKSRGEKVAPKEVESALHEHRRREGGGGHRRARRAARPGGQGVRRARAGAADRRQADPARVPEAARELHGPQVRRDRAGTARTDTGKIKKRELITG